MNIKASVLLRQAKYTEARGSLMNCQETTVTDRFQCLVQQLLRELEEAEKLTAIR
jgi:hypothetical protein